jgi:anaerobic ribonucleoside-triphosphate reductase
MSCKPISIPMKERYKCYTCHTIVSVDKNESCPQCGEIFAHLIKMCPKDHCNCTHDIMFELTFCPECGAGTCPECGCHDVMQVSRVTGYMQSVEGFNNAKKQEVKDRVRYNL